MSFLDLKFKSPFEINEALKSLFKKFKILNNKVSVKVEDNYANDAAAATAGIPVGSYYHTSGTLKIRIS